MSKTVLLTGASGYLGQALARELITRGFQVTTLTRKPFQINGATNISGWSLQNPILQNEAHADVLIHAAWDMTISGARQNEAINVTGSAHLFDEAKRIGIKQIIFISTTSAFAGAVSVYGRAKFQVEERVRAVGGVVLRPGLIHGGEAKGLVSAMKKLMAFSPVIPLFGARQIFYTSDLQSLVTGITYVTENPALAMTDKPVLASAKPLTFGQILRAIAGSRKILFIPVPWRLAYVGLLLCEKVGLTPPFKSDSLLSLMTLPPLQPVNEKIPFKNFDDGSPA